MVLYIPPSKPDQIPVIDLSATHTGDVQACQKAAAEIRKAALDTGFLYVCGHGVPDQLIQDQFAWSKRFFELPLAERMAIHLYQSPTRSGYEPIAEIGVPEAKPPEHLSPDHFRSKRSRFMTLFQAATKSRTNFSFASSWA